MFMIDSPHFKNSRSIFVNKIKRPPHRLEPAWRPQWNMVSLLFCSANYEQQPSDLWLLATQNDMAGSAIRLLHCTV